MPAKHCALLYPIEKSENVNTKGVLVSQSRNLLGFGGEILGYGLRISNNHGNFSDFYQEMAFIENDLCETVEKWLK